MDGGIENDSLKPMIWHFHIKNCAIFPIARPCVDRFSKSRQEFAVAGSHLFRNGQTFEKSWPKSGKNSPWIKNEFPMTLIAGAKRCLKKSPNAILNPSKVSQALIFICSINFERFWVPTHVWIMRESNFIHQFFTKIKISFATRMKTSIFEGENEFSQAGAGCS